MMVEKKWITVCKIFSECKSSLTDFYKYQNTYKNLKNYSGFFYLDATTFAK